MAIGIITIVHAVLAIFVVIELGLMADAVDFTTTPWGNWTPSSFSFMLFSSVWSLLVLAYLALIPLYFSKLYHSLGALVTLAITTIFWFAGSIAMAVRIGVPHCGGNDSCMTSQAAVAFGFFIWAIFTGLTAMEGLAASRGGGAQVDKVKTANANTASV
ncbi:hypothetical protein ESCO_002284 [Escovopsis weberi]|uniref:MARVEL domain-containing protein n=1 Tax=Escovopsis weberi TaxID=150374 RepID=A0A0M9VWG8_ESCWE|nr:hypothetical protein ESCO_002284 [Escovopsis weberi]